MRNFLDKMEARDVVPQCLDKTLRAKDYLQLFINHFFDEWAAQETEPRTKVVPEEHLLYLLEQLHARNECIATYRAR